MLPPNLYARVQLFAKRKQAHVTAGAACTRPFLRPQVGGRNVTAGKTRVNLPRGREAVSSVVPQTARKGTA